MDSSEDGSAVLTERSERRGSGGGWGLVGQFAAEEEVAVEVEVAGSGALGSGGGPGGPGVVPLGGGCRGGGGGGG